MTKRVKKGFRMELPCDAHVTVGVVAKECNGNLVLTQPYDEGSSKLDVVSLSLAQCEALGMTAVLEDGPEPWERVRDALTQAWRESRGCDVGPFPGTRLPEDDFATVLERVAYLLGIEKPPEIEVPNEPAELAAAEEAVAKARDAVVEAVEGWYYRGNALSLVDVKRALVNARRAEAEARAKLEDAQ